MTFDEWLQRTAPAWLVRRATTGRAWVKVIGAELDAARAALVAARRAWFVTLAPDAVVPVHGRIRRLVRYPGESVSQYRERVRRALPLYRQAGKRAAQITLLEALGFTGAEPVELYRLGAIRCDGTYASNGELKAAGAARRFEYTLNIPATLLQGVTSATLALLRAESIRWAPRWAALAGIVLTLDGLSDEAPVFEDTAMEITTRRYHLCDGSVTADGSVDADAFDSTTEELP
ncbi:MAG: hypothetical protein IV100_12645 [Myxococcales bacterium]|uniref:hypothetical protein n=1 Tax=Sediminibacterium sp. TaxID=1917865 RepID=UPI001D63085E|nr:hypothetical protein [Sediminibacterium sp.]MBT9485847.1 hypothetical protein [Sediminibacterium sp.]MBT9556875.1 hypothetical protein [Myxococcales bacterium]